MSNRRILFAAALALAAAVPVQAQSLAELRARRDSVERRYGQARADLETALNRARAVPNDSLVLQGAVVRFDSANLEARERRSLARAFDAAAAEITELFGPEGSSLIEGQRWLVTVMYPSARGAKPELVLEPVEDDARRPRASLSVPLRIPAATDLIRTQAGSNLIRTQPQVHAWLGGQFRINEPILQHYFAHRHLGLHQSSPARRCARGSISACSDIFSYSARQRWFDVGDVANTAERVPASGTVRASLLRYAVEVDGPALLSALRTSQDTTSEAFVVLAAAVGQQPEEFLRGWQARLAESGAVRVRPLPRTIVAAFGWFALCGFVAMRRRPE